MSFQQPWSDEEFSRIFSDAEENSFDTGACCQIVSAIVIALIIHQLPGEAGQEAFFLHSRIA